MQAEQSVNPRFGVVHRIEPEIRRLGLASMRELRSSGIPTGPREGPRGEHLRPVPPGGERGGERDSPSYWRVRSVRTRPASFEGEVMKQVKDCGAVARAESTRWGM